MWVFRILLDYCLCKVDVNVVTCKSSGIKKSSLISGEKINLMRIGQVLGTNAMSSKTLLKHLGQNTI